MDFEVDSSALVDFAQSLARTPSESGTEQAAVELATERFRALGFDQVEIDEVGNAIGIMGSGDGPRLLIDGHIDSIPLHSVDRWTVDPFGGEIIAGSLYGLGICDQKASIAAAAHGIAAARRLTGPFTGTVALVGSVCEEAIEGAALAPFVQRFQPDFAVTSEPSDTKMCIGQRGRAKVELRIRGRACHAGFAQEGLNAAEALALVIAEVRKMEHPVHDRLGKRDITCIDIASWPYPSVSTVPGEALGRFDCRFLPGETPVSLHDQLRSCVDRALATWTEKPEVTIGLVQAEFATWTGAEFSLEEFEPAWWTDEGSPLVQGATAGLVSVGLDPTPTHYSFCTNGSYLAGEAGIPTIGFGVGYEHMAHQVDEYVTLDSLFRGAQGFAGLVTELIARG
ncbi:MAG TPA: M20/M25/M40 family metallo-hydrolase [Acidimicrobiales bacterium]|jgi:putative selenium metabolism hydrolase|nr:M20/M25/M40 family metallo-hydrolase [Acidimicrobiales bacterium]